MTRDWLAIERAREAGKQPDYDEPKSVSRVEEAHERIDELEARLAELERRLAGGVSTGSTFSTSGKVVPHICRNCGCSTKVGPTGNILTSMPPQTEMRCGDCGYTWGVGIGL